MIEKQVFRSRITQRETSKPHRLNEIRISLNLLPLTLSLFKLSVHCVGSATNIVYGIPHLVTQKQTLVPLDMLPYQKRGFTGQMAQYLSTMGVPEDEQFSIIAQVFEVVEAEPVPRLPITLVMTDVTVRTTLDGPDVSLFGSQMMIDEATWELMERYRNDDPLANYRDVIILEALDFVPLDSLEPAIRQTPCFLCKKSLDHFVVRLPCSHLHHKSCIFRWLGSCHLCPLCQHPIVDELPEFLGMKQQDELLAMWRSAHGNASLEESIMKDRFWWAELRKKISNLAWFLFLFLFFLVSVFIGYNLEN